MLALIAICLLLHVTCDSTSIVIVIRGIAF